MSGLTLPVHTWTSDFMSTPMLKWGISRLDVISHLSWRPWFTVLFGGAIGSEQHMCNTKCRWETPCGFVDMIDAGGHLWEQRGCGHKETGGPRGQVASLHYSGASLGDCEAQSDLMKGCLEKRKCPNRKKNNLKGCTDCRWCEDGAEKQIPSFLV